MIDANKREKLHLEVTLAGPTPAALKAASHHFDEADGYRGKIGPHWFHA